MEEINPQSPLGSPEAGGQGAPKIASGAVSEGASRRRILWSVLTLNAFCALAAAVLLWRGEAAVGGSQLLRSPKKLLMVSKETGIGWVSIHGPIYHSASGRVWEHGIEQWSRKITSLAEKNEVKAIVIDIDSPGGSVGAVQELYDVIRRVREDKHKPIVAVVGDVAASGGYYLASACDKIVAHPGSLLGSIGVIFNTMNVQGLFGKLGIKSDPIKSGKLKDIGSPTRPMTKEERDLLQGIINNAYGQFVGAVAKGRGLTVAKVHPLADGRIFTGEQGLAVGLVDTLGGSREALMLAAKLAGLPAEKTPKVIHDGDSFESVLDLLDSKFDGVLHANASIGRELSEWTHMGLEYRWTGF